MDAITCIKTRRSVRRFTEEKISHELMNEIVEAASHAPSWKNTQIARYHIVENADTINYIGDECLAGFEYNGKTIKNAAALVVLTGIKGRSGFERDGSYSTPKEGGWEMFDAGIAAQTFCLAAHAKGIGSVILGIFDEEKIEERLKIDENEAVMALIAIGYPKFEPDMPKRKEVGQLLSFDE